MVVEEYIKGRELEVAVLGGYEPDTTDVGEIIPSEEFYDYEAKYLNSSKPSKLIIPAKLPEHIRPVSYTHLPHQREAAEILWLQQ